MGSFCKNASFSMKIAIKVMYVISANGTKNIWCSGLFTVKNDRLSK